MPFIERDGAQIYYECKGSGPTLVFAHGAGGNAAIWYHQIAHFATDYQVISFDHRLFGRSTHPQGALTVQQFRDDLLGLLDACDAERAHVVGQSMGGFTVLRTALDCPDRVATLTMSCTGGGIVNPNPSPAIQRLTSHNGSAVSSGIAETMSRKSQADAALMQLYESINAFNTQFDWGNLASLLGPDGAIQLESLAEVACPTLFISGAEDPLFPPDLLASYVPHFQNATIEVVEDTGHSPYFERPDVFNELLAKHIKN